MKRMGGVNAKKSCRNIKIIVEPEMSIKILVWKAEKNWNGKWSLRVKKNYEIRSKETIIEALKEENRRTIENRR